ncbi:MAG: hypothetical protein R8F63_08985 [Acidimicrobiales bacterium]|nr:hypothetical protein [Acidimicrobiales bacterium]
MAIIRQVRNFLRGLTRPTSRPQPDTSPELTLERERARGMRGD